MTVTRVRTSSGWEDISQMGPQGPAGADGATGPQGPQGIPGPQDLSPVPLLAPGADTRNVYTGAVGSIWTSARRTGDTGNRLSLDIDGKLAWGSGAGAADTTMNRSGVGSLRTDSYFTIFRPSSGQNAFGIANVGEAQFRLNITSAGTMAWSDGTLSADCSVFRANPGELRTTDTGFTSVRAAAASNGFAVRVTGDNQNRLAIGADGTLRWGPGNAAADTVLARGGAGSLQIGSATQLGRLNVIGGTAGSTSVFAGFSLSEANARILIRADGQLSWGDGTTSADTILTRVVAGRLDLGASNRKGALRTYGSATTDVVLDAVVTTDAFPRLTIGADGKHSWGDGTAAADTTLARGTVGRLDLTSRLHVISASVATALSTITTPDTNSRFTIGHDGGMSWGPGNAGTDTTLARSATARLALTGMLTTTLGVATRTKAGTPVDADWTTAPPDGTLVVDSTGSRIWARTGGVWKSVAIA